MMVEFLKVLCNRIFLLKTPYERIRNNLSINLLMTFKTILLELNYK